MARVDAGSTPCAKATEWFDGLTDKEYTWGYVNSLGPGRSMKKKKQKKADS